MHLRSFFLLCLLFLCISLKQGFSQKPAAEHWADSVLKTMTLREKIAQLIMMPVYSNRDQAYYKATLDSITKHQPGLLICFQGSPKQQTLLINQWQAAVRIPMLISMDAEWGPAMRLDSMIAFPRLMALAATADTNLIFRYGQAIGAQCHRLGLHINYAPVVDVNNNPVNPVINYRSFGENPHKVALYASVFCRGLMSEGVLPVAKHFPGHGNTSQDSHKTLPDVTDNPAVVDSVHLLPFRKMIEEQIWGIMVAHVFIPALDATKNTPSSLSPVIINGLLRKTYGYNGLILTDALGMKGVSEKSKPGSTEVKALLAGNDVLTMPENIGLSIDSILRAVKQKRISEARIDSSVRKVLMAKHREGLTQWTPLKAEGITAELNQEEYFELKQQIYCQAATVLINKNMLPLRPGASSLAMVSFRADTASSFHRLLEEQLQFDTYFIPDTLNDSTAWMLIDQASKYDQVICAVHAMSFLTKQNYGFYPRTIAAVDTLCRKTKVILTLFGNPYAFRNWSSDSLPDALLVTYERDQMAEKAAAFVLTGIRPASGVLPVTINKNMKEGFGLPTEVVGGRFVRIEPADRGYSENLLDSIDHIVMQAIADSVFPGCQILAARNGEIFYHKSFGYHTYERHKPVREHDLYDLASVTKALATTLAIMKLYEDGKLALESELQQYLPQSKGTPCATLHIDRLLTHSAGLPAWTPLYLATMSNGRPDSNYYHTFSDSLYCLKVNDSLFLRGDYADSMLIKILYSPIKPDQGYKYSDLGFMLLKAVAEQITNQSLDKYLNEQFYRPLGLNRMLFNPRSRFELSEIAPTENDVTYRHRLVHGYVHDQAAAMLGGVSGHAGLFGNAYDAAVILQMLLNYGEYGGHRFLKSSTIKRFISTYFDKNRRGLGFDKPSGTKNGNVCQEASAMSFGHSGFTGTFVWADPSNGLLYVFLSNRVYPDAENWKITQQNIRTRIHSLLYQAVNQP